MTGEQAREVFVRTLEGLRDEGLYLGPIPPLEPLKRAKWTPSRPRKKTSRPPASVSSRASDGLEEEMSRDTDPFWQVSEAAWKQLRELEEHNFGEAMAWLRQVQPLRYQELTHHWLEYISLLWASREFTAFQKALDTWVGLHVQVVKTYQLVRILQKP